MMFCFQLQFKNKYILIIMFIYQLIICWLDETADFTDSHYLTIIALYDGSQMSIRSTNLYSWSESEKGHVRVTKQITYCVSWLERRFCKAYKRHRWVTISYTVFTAIIYIDNKAVREISKQTIQSDLPDMARILLTKKKKRKKSGQVFKKIHCSYIMVTRTRVHRS